MLRDELDVRGGGKWEGYISTRNWGKGGNG